MAIQLRRGAYADFDATKMVPAEVGIVTSGDPNTDDGKAAYVAFSAGNAKRLATVEDIATDLQEATDDAVGQATARAEAAAESVEASAAQIATNTADIADLKAELSGLEPGLSAEAKAALLACFAKVAWIDEHGQDYYDALYEALYNEEPPAPGPTVIKELSASDLIFGFGNSGGLYYSDPYNGYYIYQNAKRACYPLFDIAVEPGKSYKIEWDTTKISGAVGSISVLPDNVDQPISTQSSIDYLVCEYPWLTSGTVFKIPDTLYDSPMTKIRLVWKANEADTASFNQGDIQWVKITEDSSAEEADMARMFTVDDLSYRTGVLNSPPYYDASRPNRITLWNPIDIRAESTYAVTFKKNASYPNAQIVGEILNENAVSAMASNTTIAAEDMSATGWINAGVTFDVPELINGSPAKKIRFSFRPQSGDSGRFSNNNAIVCFSISRR